VTVGKKNKENADGNLVDPTMWMVTFGDLLMLLLTFFVMLLSMSSMDNKSLKTMFSIFQGASGPLELGELKAIKSNRELSGGSGALETTSLKMLRFIKDISAEVGIPAGKTGARVDSVSMLEDLIISEENELREQILIGLESIMQFSQDERGVVISFQANILFDAAEADIKPISYPTLDMVAKVLGGVKNDILVMGHTDNVPMRTKRYRSNWELSMYRALNVQKYFIEKGIAPERFGVGGYGDIRPHVPNDSRENRGVNRRVEIILRGIS
jgi:chemotaxis protein MotB